MGVTVVYLGFPGGLGGVGISEVRTITRMTNLLAGGKSSGVGPAFCGEKAIRDDDTVDRVTTVWLDPRISRATRLFGAVLAAPSLRYRTHVNLSAGPRQIVEVDSYIQDRSIGDSLPLHHAQLVPEKRWGGGIVGISWW